MSRIGGKAIPIPSGVRVGIDGQTVRVEGPKGTLLRALHPSMAAASSDGQVRIEPRHDLRQCKQFWGLTRTLVANMIEGCFSGFEKKLVLRGVGYRAAVEGQTLTLTLGFSHPVVYEVPQGIVAKVDKDDKSPMVVVSGYDKELVGQVAANIRGFRPPEPYHGKGVCYQGEVIVLKPGKSAKKK